MYDQTVNCVVHGLLFQKEYPTLSSWEEFGAAFLVVLLSAALAAASLRYYEGPIRRWGRRKRYRLGHEQRSPAAAVPASPSPRLD